MLEALLGECSASQRRPVETLGRCTLFRLSKGRTPVAGKISAGRLMGTAVRFRHPRFSLLFNCRPVRMICLAIDYGPCGVESGKTRHGANRVLIERQRFGVPSLGR